MATKKSGMSDFARDLYTGPQHTLASVKRASVNDENNRQRKVAEKQKAGSSKESKAKSRRKISKLDTECRFSQNLSKAYNNKDKQSYVGRRVPHLLERQQDPCKPDVNPDIDQLERHFSDMHIGEEQGPSHGPDDHNTNDGDLSEERELHSNTPSLQQSSPRDEGSVPDILVKTDEHYSGTNNSTSAIEMPDQYGSKLPDKDSSSSSEDETAIIEYTLSSDPENADGNSIKPTVNGGNGKMAKGTLQLDDLPEQHHHINDYDNQDTLHQTVERNDKKTDKRPPSGKGQTPKKTLNNKSKPKSISTDKPKTNKQSNVPLQAQGEKHAKAKNVSAPARIPAHRGPSQRNNIKMRANIDFYTNTIRSRPLPGNTIEEMLRWKGNYECLERNHRYIQWLFPIPEGGGMNREAQPLMEHEAKAIRDSDQARDRVMRAYKMMLDFYGMRLQDELTGTVERSKNWKDRYKHLNKSRHNYLRITRIITSLGELGFERYQVPWLDFFFVEILSNGELQNIRKRRCLQYWVFAIKDDGEREAMYMRYLKFFENIKSQDDYSDDFDSESEDDDGEYTADRYADFLEGKGHGHGRGDSGGGGGWDGRTGAGVVGQDGSRQKTK